MLRHTVLTLQGNSGEEMGQGQSLATAVHTAVRTRAASQGAESTVGSTGKKELFFKQGSGILAVVVFLRAEDKYSVPSCTARA